MSFSCNPHGHDPSPSVSFFTPLHRFIKDLQESMISDISPFHYHRIAHAIRPAQDIFQNNIIITGPHFDIAERDRTGERICLAEVITSINQEKGATELLARKLVVQHRLIHFFIKAWDDPAFVFLEAVHREVLDSVRALVLKHFGDVTSVNLADAVLTAMNAHITDCMKVASGHIHWFLHLEALPLSLDHGDRYGYASQFQDNYIAEQGRFNDISAEDMQSAFTVMANVQGHFLGAHMRFVDNIANVINYDMLHSVGGVSFLLLCEKIESILKIES